LKIEYRPIGKMTLTLWWNRTWWAERL